MARSDREFPICPLRDTRCIGAGCAWSRHTVEMGGMWLFSCAVPTESEGLPVIDRREPGKDPCERS